MGARGGGSAVLSFAGGSGHAGGNFAAEENVSQLGIVNEDITGAGDRLHRVITAHFPSINRVFFHPLQQNILAFNDTAVTPHMGGVAPTDIGIKHDSGAVTANIHTGIMETQTGILTKGFVATAAVFACKCGTEHHDISAFAPVTIIGTAAEAFAGGPNMLAVPGFALIPGAFKHCTRVEGGNHAGVVHNTVGVTILITGVTVAGLFLVGRDHQCLQRLVQFAGGNIILHFAAAELRQRIISVFAGVECDSVCAQKDTIFAAGAPVMDSGAGFLIVYIIGTVVAGGSGDDLATGCMDFGRNQNGTYQYQNQQQGQDPLIELLHR